MPRRLLLALTAGAALSLTACGAGPLTAGEVATAAEDALEEQFRARPDISCPEGLEREDGASVRCTLTAEDDPTELGVTVTVLSTDDDDLRLDVTVDDAPAD